MYRKLDMNIDAVWARKGGGAEASLWCCCIEYAVISYNKYNIISSIYYMEDGNGSSNRRLHKRHSGLRIFLQIPVVNE